MWNEFLPISMPITAIAGLCCRGHGVLLVLAPLASLSLAGQEHGRTIPLADIEQRLMLQERTRVLPYQNTRLSYYDAVS